MSPSLLTTRPTLSPNPCLVSFAPASHFQDPTLVPKPHDAVCSVTLLVSLQLHGPRMGIYAGWSARSLPMEGLGSEGEGGGTALLRPNEWWWLRGEGQTCLPPCGLENQGSWFAMRAENETDTKRGTREELEKPHGTGFLIKACTQGPVITLWVLWGNSVSFQ